MIDVNYMALLGGKETMAEEMDQREDIEKIRKGEG